MQIFLNVLSLIFFSKIRQEGMLDSKTFWKEFKPYFVTKGQGDSELTISENDCLISDPQSVAEILNNHFVSIGQTTNSIHKGLTENSTITEIIRYFKEHSSIKTINNFLTKNSTLSFKPITKESLRYIIVKLNHKKVHGHDMLNAKSLKISVDIILQPLLNIINKCIIQGTFPNFLKKAIVSPVYKKKDSLRKKN